MTDEEKGKLVRENAAFIDKCDRSGRSSHVKTIASNIEYYNNIQIDPATAAALKADNLPILPINEIRPAIELLIAMLTENSPRFSAMPFESSDGEDAAYISSLLFYIWNLSNGNEQVARAIRDAEIGGLFAIFNYADMEADFGRGEIKFNRVNPEHLYLSPYLRNADGSDLQEFAIAFKIEEEMAKLQFPDIDFTKVGVGSTLTEYSGSGEKSYGEIFKTTDMTGVYYTLIDRYKLVKEKRYLITDPETGYERLFDKKQLERFLNEDAVIITKLNQNSGYVYDDNEVENFREVLRTYGDLYHQIVNPFDPNVPMLMEGAERGMEGEVPNSTTQIQMTTISELINNGILVQKEVTVQRVKRIYSIGDHLIYSDIMPISELPLALTMIGDNDNPYPISDVTLVMPLQDQLNYTNDIINKYNKALSTINVFVPTGTDKSAISKKIAKPGMQLHEIPFDEGLPVVVQLTQMSSSLYAEKASLIQQIQRVLGSYALQDGDTTEAPQTKGGTLLMDEFGQRRVSVKRKRIERCIDRLAKNIMEMVPSVYKSRKVIRILKPNKKNEVVVLNDPRRDSNITRIVNDLSVKYDVSYVSGSMLATNLMAKFDMLEKMYTMGALRDPKALIELLPVENVQEILEREDRLKQYEQQIAGMEQEIKKLRGDNQTATRETLNAKKQAEVQKFKSELKDVGNKIKAQAIIAKDKLKADKSSPKKNKTSG